MESKYWNFSFWNTIIESRLRLRAHIVKSETPDLFYVPNKDEVLKASVLDNDRMMRKDRPCYKILVIIGYMIKLITLFSQGFAYKMHCKHNTISIMGFGLSWLSVWQIMSASYPTLNKYWPIPIGMFLMLIISRFHFKKLNCESGLMISNEIFPVYSPNSRLVILKKEDSMLVNNYKFPIHYRNIDTTVYKDDETKVYLLNNSAYSAVECGSLPLEMFSDNGIILSKDIKDEQITLQIADPVIGVNTCVDHLNLNIKSIFSKFYISIYDYNSPYNHVSHLPFPGSIEVNFFKFCELYSKYKFFKKDLENYKPNDNNNEPLPPLNYTERVSIVSNWVDSLKNSDNMKRRLKQYLLQCIAHYHQKPYKMTRTNLEYRIRWRNHMLWAIGSDRLNQKVVTTGVTPEYSDLGNETLFGGKYGANEEEIRANIEEIIKNPGTEEGLRKACTKKDIIVKESEECTIEVSHKAYSTNMLLPTYEANGKIKNQFKNIRRKCMTCDSEHDFDVDLRVRQLYTEHLSKRREGLPFVSFEAIHIQEKSEKISFVQKTETAAPVNWMKGKFYLVEGAFEKRKNKKIKNTEFPRKLSPYFEDSKINDYSNSIEKRKKKSKKCQKNHKTSKKNLLVNREAYGRSDKNKNAKGGEKEIKEISASEALNILAKKYGKKDDMLIDWVSIIMNVQRKIENYAKRKGNRPPNIGGLFPTKSARLAFNDLPLLIN